MTWQSIGTGIGAVFLAIAGFFGSVTLTDTPIGATTYQVWQGGTGLSSVATNRLLIGTGGQALSTIASTGLPYVTSVAQTVPTGFTVSGSPVTTTGTLAISFDTGYSLPLTASQSAWELLKDTGPYLPLTGGTLTGSLFGTTASFSGNVDIAGDLTVNSGNHIFLHGLQALDTQGIHLHSANGTEIGFMGTANTANTTWNGTALFSGASPDVTTGVNENFTIAPNGGITAITGNASVSSNFEVGGYASASQYFGDGQNLTLSRIGNSTYKSVQDLQNIFHSSGYVSGGTITDAGGGSVTVAAGTGLIRATATSVATIQYFDWPASGSFSIPTDSIRYIGVSYNSGVPKVHTQTTDSWDNKTAFPLGRVVRESGTTIHIEQNNFAVGDHAANMILREYETMPLARDERTGGLVLSDGTRTIQMTAGALWDRLNRFPISAFDSSAAGRFDEYYYNGSAWIASASNSQWPNTQYNDITSGLVTMTNNRWANLWFYIETDGDVVMIWGRGQYTSQALAEAEAIPATLPNRLTGTGRLIGRLTFQKSASSASVQSAFSTAFTASPISDHSLLTNLAWTSSGHTGTANTLAGFNSSGVASQSLESKFMFLDGSRAFTGKIQGTGASFSTNFEVTGYASASSYKGGAIALTGIGSNSFAGSLNVSKSITGGGITGSAWAGGGLTACSTAGKVLRYNAGQYSCGTLGASDLPDAVADGATKGVAAFTAADFNSTTGVISIDYTNGQAASSLLKGFLTAADWTTFSGKQAGDATLTALAAYNTNGILTQTAADTFTGRTLTGTTNQITVTNGDGVAANPTLSIPNTFVMPGNASISGQLELTPSTDPAIANGPLGAQIKVNNNAAARGIWMGFDSTLNVGYIGAARFGSGAHPIILNPDSYLSGGPVGIGTQNVTERLEVSGAASISQYLLVGSLPRLGKTIAQFASVSNDFVQVNLQNFSTGTSASADFVITRDGGTQNTQYLNLGLNGSLYRDWNYDIAGAKDGYLYMSDNDLAIGTASTAANVGLKFFTGGTRSTNKRFSIFSTGASLSVPFEFTGAASGSTLRLASVFAGGSGDYTNITGAQIKLVDTGSFGIRIPHISGHATWSTFYNYETGKSVFWGEDTDTGTYYFRGRDVNIGNDASVSGRFEITGGGDSGMYSTFTGNQRWVINNQGQCSTCLSSFAVIASGSAGANQQMFSSTYTTSGSAIADSYRMLALGTGGVSLVAGNAAGVLRIYTGAVSTERARFDNTGRLGLATTAPAQELHISSASEGNLLRLQDSTNTCDLDPDATLTTTCTSDARLKKNIKDFNGAMDYLNGFHVREYDMINGGEHLVGVIAQELLKTHPEMVHMGDDGYYKVQEVPSWTIIKAVQELDARVTALEKGGGATIDLQAQLDNLSFMQLLKLLIMKIL